MQAKSSNHGHNLGALITPKLLHETFLAMIPWPKDLQAIPYAEATDQALSNPENCFSALKALSELPGGLEGALRVDLMADLLPPPTDPTFPEHALGLILLLDQGPRGVLRKGTDPRWTGGFFHPLSLKIVRQLYTLPHKLCPLHPHRWIDELGYSPDHYIFAWSWMVAPLIHSENVVDQFAQVAMHQALRPRLEQWSNRTDPFAAELSEKRDNPYAFSAIINAGPPPADENPLGLGRKPDCADFLFWIFLIDELHKPIVEKFGRYPNMNDMAGRISTEEEIEFLKKMGDFGRTGRPALVAKIREDILAGRWSPIGTEVI